MEDIMPAKPGKLKKSCLLIPLSLIGLIALLLAASALSNLGFPQQSELQDHLSVLDKARLSEALHLRATLGDAVWPGWSQADIPLIVYNEQYAFLVAYSNPPDGWLKVPNLEARGGPWEQVQDDSFMNEPYFRTAITDTNKTPQSFTVLIGDQWVATFMTREYSQINFSQSFRQDMPPVISNFIPVRLIWTFMMGKTDTYIAALEHESFHAFEGQLAVEQLNASEQMYSVEETYPFDAMEEPWKHEMEVLLQAIQAPTDPEAIVLARQFLQLRADRRSALTSDQVDLERLREWEEGLAKYAELEITRQAETANYIPFGSILSDKEFKNYQGQQQFWASQLMEATRTQGRSGDTRFYYSGNALAVLLDRMMPGWKPAAIPRGAYLDDLIQEAVR
jgi:hypothetical protein